VRFLILVFFFRLQISTHHADDSIDPLLAAALAHASTTTTVLSNRKKDQCCVDPIDKKSETFSNEWQNGVVFVEPNNDDPKDRAAAATTSSDPTRIALDPNDSGSLRRSHEGFDWQVH